MSLIALNSFLLSPSIQVKPLTPQKETSEVELGHPAPDFVARDLEGNQVSLKTLIAGRKALLLFYRGGWCPICNRQLAAISQDRLRFTELGATIVAVSSDAVEKGAELLRKLSLPFSLLSDSQLEGIDAYGVRDLNPTEKVRGMGITRLSMPAAFVIDDAGIVRYKHVGKNPSDRPSNEELLKALAEVDKPMGHSPPASKADACEILGGNE